MDYVRVQVGRDAGCLRTGATQPLLPMGFCKRENPFDIPMNIVAQCIRKKNRRCFAKKYAARRGAKFLRS